MPDLITHTAGAYLLKKGCRITGFIVLLYLGAMLPDLVSRPLHIFWPRTIWAAQALHSPVGVFLVCWLVSLFFRVDQRKSVFGLLFAGSVLHGLMDVLQKHLIGGYMWFFPFSTRSFPGGLFWPDTSVRLLPYTILLVAIVFVISCWKKSRNKTTERTEHTEKKIS